MDFITGKSCCFIVPGVVASIIQTRIKKNNRHSAIPGKISIECI